MSQDIDFMFDVFFRLGMIIALPFFYFSHLYFSLFNLLLVPAIAFPPECHYFREREVL